MQGIGKKMGKDGMRPRGELAKLLNYWLLSLDSNQEPFG